MLSDAEELKVFMDKAYNQLLTDGEITNFISQHHQYLDTDNRFDFEI